MEKKSSLKEKISNNPLIICDFHYIVIFVIIFKIIDTKQGIDKKILYFMLFSLIIYSFGRVTCSGKIIAINHFLYALSMVTTPLLSNDRELLLLIIAMSIVAIGSRRYFNGCLIRKVEKKTSLVDNSFTKILDWDLIFPGIGLLATYKLNKII